MKKAILILLFVVATTSLLAQSFGIVEADKINLYKENIGGDVTSTLSRAQLFKTIDKDDNGEKIKIVTYEPNRTLTGWVNNNDQITLKDNLLELSNKHHELNRSNSYIASMWSFLENKTWFYVDDNNKIDPKSYHEFNYKKINHSGYEFVPVVEVRYDKDRDLYNLSSDLFLLDLLGFATEIKFKSSDTIIVKYGQTDREYVSSTSLRYEKLIEAREQEESLKQMKLDKKLSEKVEGAKYSIETDSFDRGLLSALIGEWSIDSNHNSRLLKINSDYSFSLKVNIGQDYITFHGYSEVDNSNIFLYTVYTDNEHVNNSNKVFDPFVLGYTKTGDLELTSDCYDFGFHPVKSDVFYKEN